MGSLARGVAPLALIAATGCAAAPIASVDPCGEARVEVTAGLPPDDSEVDLLFVIDSSPAIEGFRATVAAQVDRIVGVLASGDVDGDGVMDFRPSNTLRVAVIDTDMGGPTCGAGDGGAFRASPCATDARDGVLSVVARQPERSSIAAGASCVAASVGSAGCPFDRGMDAMIAALDPIPDAFSNRDATLAVIVIAAEDDCSTEHPEIFSTDVPVGLRCLASLDQLQDVDDVATRLLALRREPELFLLAIVSGLPPSLAEEPPTTVLAAPELQEQADPAMPDRLTPACATATSPAFPARRWLGLASAIDARGGSANSQSICSDDFLRALEEYEQDWPPFFGGVCLPRELNPDADGRVDCDVLMALPPIGSSLDPEHCADLPSPETFTLDHIEPTSNGAMREVCRVRQVAAVDAGTIVGWAYDDGSPVLGVWSALPIGCSQRVGLSVVELERGAELRVTCDERLTPSSHSAAQRGSICNPGSDIPTSCELGHAIDGDASTATLACDPFDRTCQLACTSDDDCVTGGLTGFVCDQRSAQTYFASGVPTGIDPSAVHAFCIDLACGP